MLPIDFTERMKVMLGNDFDKFIDSYNYEKYQSIRINTLKTSVDEIKEIVIKNVESKKDNYINVNWKTIFDNNVPWEKSGFYYDEQSRPGKHPYHDAGLYYIQEPSAMLPVNLMNVKPGDIVLDLCAAPGGKSSQIAQKLNGEGLLICNEINPQRAKILSENIERMGITNAIVTNESPKNLSEKFFEYFDKILVDAPCSGEGMFRKNDDACNEWSLQNVKICAERQDEILDYAASMLRPGGVLVYSTCTFAPDENEGSINRFIKRNKDFTIEELNDRIPECLKKDSNGRVEYYKDSVDEITRTIRLWPHIINGEGHYAALLHKNGELESEYHRTSKYGEEKYVNEKSCKEYIEFKNMYLNSKYLNDNSNYHFFGEQLYLMPKNSPSLKNLRVLRPGLHLGTIKKGRFDPSHALALYLKKSEVKLTVDFDSESEEIRKYISGQTFDMEGEKGWYLICVDGYSIAFGKLAGEIMKNHYPKGLRKNM